MNYIATIGFFDGVHCGHQYLIRQLTDEAKCRGMESMIITFPQHPLLTIRPDFKPQLITTAEEKERLLYEAGVDRVVMLPFTKEIQEMSAKDFMHTVLHDRLGVKSLYIGYDHRFGHNRNEGFEDYVRYGKEMSMEVVQSSEFMLNDEQSENKCSSSSIRKMLLDGDVASAAQLLGRPYELTGTVASGFQVGRRIGYPTANIKPDSEYKIIPGTGVYAVSGGMLNIGTRPTLNNGTNRSIEVHLFDFHEDIYSQQLTIQFIARIRDERKFDSLDALIAQLQSDEIECRKRNNIMHS